MKTANISYTRNHLCELLDRVRAGESILIVDRKHPVARLGPAGAEDAGAVSGWVTEQAGRGVVSLPDRPLDAAAVRRRKLPRPRHGGHVVKALLAERESGR